MADVQEGSPTSGGTVAPCPSSDWITDEAGPVRTVAGVLAEFFHIARRTAVYPNIGSNLAYVALGLIDEAVEALVTDPSEKLAELGDVAWYLAMLAVEAPSAVDLGAIDARVRADRRSRGAGGAAGQHDEGFWWTHLVKNAGLAAGRAKKQLRDGALDEQRMAAATAEVAIALDRLASCSGSSLEQLCAQVAEKLQSRSARGVLGGDGDHR